ncbi:MAG: aminoglycoside phosphotransferase family protein [Bacteroidaceae bacterium]|nr:aminoglycoside phosphotransferase family protein [Bacteroidaceae bacterium]
MGAEIVGHFQIEGTVVKVEPLGNGLINDTYKVTTAEADKPDYVLQRINHAIFQDVDLLQHNIEVVTAHIRQKLEESGTTDIDRKVLRFIPTESGKTYYFDGTSYWRVMVFIPRAQTFETVNAAYSYDAGKAFGHFQAMLADLPEQLGETIPNFHNMEFRLQQLHEAVQADAAGRVKEMQPYLDEIERRTAYMCQAEQLYREGRLTKRICHCDTKVNNMMFDENGEVLCVIDLDTVMPSFIFSDYGDFLRTAANTAAEDEPDLSKIGFNTEIYEAFSSGYLESASTFLTPLEKDLLPYAVALFPYMQCVRFLADYLNGDTYYKIQYPEHNLVRTRAQFRLLQCVEAHFSASK